MSLTSQLGNARAALSASPASGKTIRALRPVIICLVTASATVSGSNGGSTKPIPCSKPPS